MFATNLQVQQYGAGRVLTWWQGHIPPQGFGEGEEIIDNSSYQRVATVRAGNGFKADLHEFEITPRGTALITVFEPIECNLSGVGGPRHSAVTDSAFQEIDLATGLVRREWTSLDHVALSDSYSTATGSSDEWPLDYFHMNSIDQQSDGNTLISARNTWSMYELNTTTGQVFARIGGKQSNFKLGSGAATAFQHDASVLSSGTVSVFDNGGVPKVHPQSRVLLLSLNAKKKTDSVLSTFEHASPPLSSGSQGNVQPLEDGDFFVGWGSEPYFSEYSASGQLLYDAHMPRPYQSYRGYRFSWTGSPVKPPSAAAVRSSSGAVTVYASWNGDTRTVNWRLLAGPSTTDLLDAASAPRTGYETALRAPSHAAWVAVESPRRERRSAGHLAARENLASGRSPHEHAAALLPRQPELGDRLAHARVVGMAVVVEDHHGIARERAPPRAEGGEDGLALVRGVDEEQLHGGIAGARAGAVGKLAHSMRWRTGSPAPASARRR